MNQMEASALLVFTASQREDMINAEMSTLQGLSDRVCAGEEGKDIKGRGVGAGRGQGRGALCHRRGRRQWCRNPFYFDFR